MVLDLGIFKRKTSQLEMEDNDFYYSTLYRDLSEKTLGNTSGIYSRFYMVFFFQSDWLENLLKFIVFTIALTFMLILSTELDKPDMFSVNLTTILTTTAF